MFKKNYLPHIWAKIALLHLALLLLGLEIVPLVPTIIAAPIVTYGCIGCMSFMWAAATMPYPMELPLIVKFWEWAGRKWTYTTLPCEVESVYGPARWLRNPYGFGYTEVFSSDGERLGHYQDIYDDWVFVKHEPGKYLPLIAKLRSPSK